MRLTGPARHPVGRLAAQIGLAFAVTMASVGVLVFHVAQYGTDRRIDGQLAYHRAKFTAGADRAAHPTAAVAARIAQWQARKIVSERTYLLFDGGGRRVAGRLALPPLPEGFSNVRFKGGGRTWQQGRALTRRLADGGRVIVVQHSDAAANLEAMLLPLIAAILLVASLTGIAATLLFARLTARRLAATQAAADAIAAGDRARRIDTSGLDGMFLVQARSLNAMLDRMQQMALTQRHFASALAHDLRTPLTRMKGLLAQARGHEMADGQSPIERAERECAGIIAIFDSLLRLAELESGRHSSAMLVQSLDAVVLDVAETMEPVFADAGRRLVVDVESPVTARCDAALVTQLLVNLLENVLSHTASGTGAAVVLAERQGRAVLTIADAGPGLTAAERGRVLLPFERGGGADSRGSGLGLAIAKAIAEFHGWAMELEDNRPGLRVVITLAAEGQAGSLRPAMAAA